jgi:hypothetical protein
MPSMLSGWALDVRKGPSCDNLFLDRFEKSGIIIVRVPPRCIPIEEQQTSNEHPS